MLQMRLLSRSSRDDGVVRDGDGHGWILKPELQMPADVLQFIFLLFHRHCIPLGWSS